MYDNEIPRSVYPDLEPLLAEVAAPIQYVGGEVNSQPQDWNCGGDVTVRWALSYPDAYEVAISNQGVQILYELLNERSDTLAERVYAPWPDLERAMRAHGVPAFSVESHRPVGAFDVLGLSLATELTYTNVLTVLDLAGVPFRAAERDDTHPLVVAGGHAAFNPEPMAPFLDAVVLGDGEEAVAAVSAVIADHKRQGSPGGRVGLLERLAREAGCYVPRFYAVDYAPDGRIERVRPTHPGIPATVSKYTLMDLDEWPYPRAPIVPWSQAVHERMSVEIFRGCLRGCRFCQAGMISRPVRERSISTVGDMVATGLAATGFEEVGLLSLSSADHSEIGPITRELAERYEGDMVSLSLPSTRVDAFNIELADQLGRGGRRSGLTFAPEGGSERMRQVINKMVSADDLIRTVRTAYSQGWRSVKLYFMCGLPTETDADVVEIATLAARVIEAGREVTGRRDVACTVSIGGFVPKPHTPFQWAGQASAETIDHRLRLLRDTVRADRRFGKAITVRTHSGKPGVIEGLLARGDRRVADVIERVWREGGRFDGWREHFDFDRWMTAGAAVLEPFGVSVAWYTERERDYDEVLPWDHLDAGLDRDWLWEDWQDALAGGEVEDCRWSACYDCGVCPGLGVDIQIGPTGGHIEVGERTRLAVSPV